MTLVFDQGLPISLAAMLSDNGFETRHVGQIGMATAPDLKIIDHARENDFVYITLDADFQAIVALSGITKPSIIRFRIEGTKDQDYLKILSSLLGNSMKTCGGERS